MILPAAILNGKQTKKNKVFDAQQHNRELIMMAVGGRLLREIY
jgi:hypothetical protein